MLLEAEAVGVCVDRIEIVEQLMHPMGALFGHREVQAGVTLKDTREDQVRQPAMA